VILNFEKNYGYKTAENGHIARNGIDYQNNKDDFDIDIKFCYFD
jgi:hypothetical protein